MFLYLVRGLFVVCLQSAQNLYVCSQLVQSLCGRWFAVRSIDSLLLSGLSVVWLIFIHILFFVCSDFL